VFEIADPSDIFCGKIGAYGEGPSEWETLLLMSFNFNTLFFEDYYNVKWSNPGEEISITWSTVDTVLQLPLSGGQVAAAAAAGPYESIFQTAFQLWDDALETVSFVQTNEGNAADVTLAVVNIDGPFGIAGFWNSAWISGIIFKSTIRFDLGDIGVVDLLTTSLHEIGNVLGLGDIRPTIAYRSVQEDPFQEDFSGATLWQDDLDIIRAYYGETWGTSGNDVMSGSAALDILVGDTGNDDMSGNGAGDLLYGKEGDDTLRGGAGLDTLYGGENDDRLEGGADNDMLDGGDENDELYGGGSGLDTLLGGRGSDFLFGENGNDWLEGGDGFDLLNGGTDDDTLIGGNGNDRLLGNLGNDSLEGDAGNDTLFGGPSGNDTLKGGDNDDQLFGETGRDFLQGDDGNDTLNGGSNDDTLLGGNGDDSLEGGSGNDQLFGGPTGADTLKGGQGSDFLFAESADDVLEGGDGFDLMNGGAGDDVMRGGNGGDQMIGNLGNDLIEGDAGDDNIFGSAGNDTLAGGTGNDTLRGELGADTFIFEDGFGTDEIIGFQLTGGDVINLALVSGITSFSDLQNNHLSQDGADAVITDGANTIRLVGIDENGLLADDFSFIIV